MLSSSSFSPLPASQRALRLRPHRIRRDHEQRIGFWIWNVDDPQHSSAARAPERDARAIAPGSIFQRPCQNFLHFLFIDPVSV
jgi:hypothetical protein